MLVLLKSGRRLSIASHHTVFQPLGPYREGEVIDPVTSPLSPEKASAYLKGGAAIIVDDRVEIVEQVTRHVGAWDDSSKVELKSEDATVFGPPPTPPDRRAVCVAAACGCCD